MAYAAPYSILHVIISLLNAIVAHDKTYEATIRLGLRTTTDDAEGEVLVDDMLTKSRGST